MKMRQRRYPRAQWWLTELRHVIEASMDDRGNVVSPAGMAQRIERLYVRVSKGWNFR